MIKASSVVRRVGTLGCATIVALAGSHTFSQESAAPAPLHLQYRYIGPTGNRVPAVAGVRGNPRIYYVGAASGGVFNTTDGGLTWRPIFDDQSVASIGAIAVAPSDPNVVWVGTGETFIRSNISIGDGIYKSADAGKTWTHRGLDQTGRIGRIVVDPKDPDVVFAAALGHSYGPQQDRGVFRTKNGGTTWEKVLFVDENTGCADVVMDPNNSRILFAGMWQLVIHTWERDSGGPGSGIYMSRDSGTTWKRLTGHGLPDPPMGKIGLAVAPSNSNRVYALIETTDGGLWRSDDGGETWKLMNQDHDLSERWHYYTRVAVAPDNANEMYFVASRLSVSHDGGTKVERMGGGGDNHDMWIDPADPDRMIIGNDGGVIISTNHGQSWLRPALPIAQMYHVHTDNQIPYNVYGNMQDGPAYKGPSNSRQSNGVIPAAAWDTVAGCESGFAIPDPVDSNIVWSDCYEGRLDRWDARTRQAQSVWPWPDSALGWRPADLRYRFNWTTPIAISPHDHNRILVGSQYLHVTTDGGRSWKVISPDLTTNDKSKQQMSGGLTADMFTVETAPVVFAIAESPREKGLIWAGTNDGQVQVTRDDGVHWTNVTANIPDLPAWGTVSNIEPSRHDAGTCYLTVDLHQVNNRDPFVYKTTDYGKTWKRITSGIPKSVFSYAHCIREDPVRKGLLYLGTENALYVSFDDGENWTPLQANLPHAPVYWLTIQEHFNDLVVATYGRGFWILDDLTPLQQMSGSVRTSDVHLFPPHPVYRFRFVTEPGDRQATVATGRNPPGAALNYYLKSATTGPVKVTILDARGGPVRTLRAPGEAGVNRVWWDLRYETPEPPKLWTSPPGHPHFPTGPNGRPYQAWQNTHARIWQGESGVLVAPGTYTVKLAASGREQTQQIVVRKDPNSTGTDADVQAQAAMVMGLRDDIQQVASLIDVSEMIRKQVADLKKVLRGQSDASSILTAAGELDRKVAAFEDNLFQMQSTGYQDGLRTPRRLYEKLLQLIFDVGTDGADFAPTTQQVEVRELYSRQLADYQHGLDALLNNDLRAFNELLRQRNITNISVPPRDGAKK